MTAKVGERCLLGPNVVLGKNVVIGDGCVIENATIMEGTVVGSNCVVKSCIIGWHNRLQDNVRVEKVFSGDDVTFKEGVCLVDYTICPNKVVAESNPEVRKVIISLVCSTNTT